MQPRSALGVTVDERQRFRIAAISDGYPHYVHLICERLFWAMFEDPCRCSISSTDHYQAAVASALLGIEPTLKRAYDQATMKDTDGYEEVLWAVVDHSDLIRPIDAIYESYLQLMDFLEDEPLDRATFVNRLNSLKTAGFGKILVSDRRGWYKFRENITRGYVRLRAEDQGIQLALDVSPGPVTSTSRQRGARKSRRGTTVAQWRSTRNPTGF